MYFQLPLDDPRHRAGDRRPAEGVARSGANLGGSQLQFWRHVGIPVLMPSLLGAIILLFGNAFAAYATAYSLTPDVNPIVPEPDRPRTTRGTCSTTRTRAGDRVRDVLRRYAATMLIYIPLQRRSARWMR